MHSRSLILVLLLACGVCGQNAGNSGAHANNVEKGYPFGKLRLSEDGKQEELLPSVEVEIPSSNQETVVSSNVQPLPSPCVGITRPLTKLPYPKDKTKFIQCRDEYHYEILTCPEGVEYNEQTNACDVPSPITINRCEREKPCLNDGQCSVHSNSTFKCTCRPDWTGDRCETPMNSCVKKPCGPNAECRPLKTSDYEQDYVCICHGLKGYGLNCREAVPNPCLSSEEQFYPYAFSQRAYIQCDGELIFFQPCGASLYWSQEDKICDRKRPTKTEKPAFMKVPAESNVNVNQQAAVDNETVDESAETTTTLRTEQVKPPMQTMQRETEQPATFIPARVANRQQLLASMQQREKEQPMQETTGPFGSSANLLPARQELINKPKQWSAQQFDSNIRRPTIVSPARSPSMTEIPTEPWTATSTERSDAEMNMDETQFQPSHQQQNFQQKPQGFGSQQWLNQLPESNKQNGQRFATQPQSWQTSQTVQQQRRFPEQGQQTFMESSQTAPQTVAGAQGFQGHNMREQEQTWQTRPNTFNSGSQVAPSRQTVQNRPRTQELTQQQSLDMNTPAFNNMRSQGFQGQTLPEQEESWQSKSTSITGQPQQNWQNSQSLQSQQNTQRFAGQPQSWQGEFAPVETSTAAQSVVRLQGFKSQNFQDQEQTWQNKVQKPPVRGPSSQVFAFKPTQWSDSTKQENKLPSQTWSQNQQVLMGDSSSQMQAMPSTIQQQQQQPRDQQTFEQQQQPWSAKQSLQKTQVNNFGDFKFQPTDDINTHTSMSSHGQTWSQTGNQGGFQGLATQSQRAPGPMRANEQGQTETGHQLVTEQRKAPNAIPTKLFGSWASRSS